MLMGCKRAAPPQNARMMRVIPVRALIIDDDESVCRRLGDWLREAAYDVVTFTAADVGLAHTARAPAQIALVDLRMADQDGIGVVAALHEAAPKMRIIAMSAFPEPQQIIAAMRAGARDLLEKPIQRAPLLETLERQLAHGGIQIRSEQEFHRRLGARIRSLRMQSDRSLAEVASACGFTAAQLSQIELGRSGTSAWALARICGALEIPLDRLLGQL
jgi:DNA-binding NtrC family response regulator